MNQVSVLREALNQLVSTLDYADSTDERDVVKAHEYARAVFDLTTEEPK